MFESVTDWIADNLFIAAPVVAFIVSYALYNVAGKQVLGADDDYWPALRRRLLPLLDRLGATSGLYAAHQQSESEFVGVIEMDLDEFERELEAAGYYRNPLAAIKTSPDGWESHGSWAKRYGTIRDLGDALHGVPQPITGLVFRYLGRFFQAGGDVLAPRQTHVTLYKRTVEDDERIHLYAHDEPNSLNPLTAWKHYVGSGQSHERGVQKVRELLDRRDIDYHVLA